MALIRTLNTAVSGLRAQSTKTDVVGNNLANSTTTGFKSSRVTFQTVLSQTMERGTAPEGNFGGSDPKQVGLGTMVQETSKDFSQGPIKTTGRNTDVAIEGDGFFVMQDNKGELGFSRDGSLGLNRNNKLYNPSTGFKVMGLNANRETFEIPEGGDLEPIDIPLGKQSIAEATSNLKVDGNFDADGELASSGSELHSVAKFLDGSGDPAGVDTDLTDLQQATPTGPTSLGLTDGDVIRISAKKGPRNIPEKKFIIDDEPAPEADGYGTKLDDLLDFMEGSLGIAQSRDNVNVNADAYSSNVLEDVVEAGDDFTDMSYSTNGRVNWEDQGVQAGDYFRVLSGEASGQNIQVKEIRDDAGTNDELVFAGEGFDDSLSLPTEDDKFAINNEARVALGTEDTNSSGGPGPHATPLEDRNVQEGRMAIFSNAGKDNAIQELELAKDNGDIISAFNKKAEATGESTVLNGKVFDSLGTPHQIEITYTKVATSNRGSKYRWIAESEAQTGEVEEADPRVGADGPADSKTFVDDRVIGTGEINFDQDGQFLGENPEPNISMKLDDTGAESPLTVTMDHSKLTALTNFTSEVEIAEQDGFKHGVLNDFSVGKDGTIRGQFDNGLTRKLAKVQLARFDNNNGLNEDGGNLFRTGANSGEPRIGNPGEFGRGTLRGGALEESNVDVAEQFTEMIISQRSFQANSRAISTADRMLQEVVNLR